MLGDTGIAKNGRKKKVALLRIDFRAVNKSMTGKPTTGLDG
jgi:hypothetical protein